MNTLFTDHLAAVEEGHFIQEQLGKTAYLACDMQRNLYVFTHEELKAFKKKLKILEIFHPGGRINGYKGLLSSYTQP